MDAALPVLILLQIAPVYSNYVLVNEQLTWEGARNYCRKNHSDLATINSENEQDLALNTIANETEITWIGLQRNSTSKTGWVWSSGTVVNTFFWAAKQPESTKQQNGAIYEGMWHDDYSYYAHPFLCSVDSTGEMTTRGPEYPVTQAPTTVEPVHLVTEIMTWEEALDYCKKTGKKLASLRDSADLERIGKELSNRNIGEQVWMALHFFAGEWLWLDGQRADSLGLSLCPAPGMGCGALRVEASSVIGSYSNSPTFVYHWTDSYCNLRFPFICD